ncbi:hypothetical protein DSO57_1023401 [Entomophthora muscae]|uniref:Uncharacterized protein n=2 Tax=Entomophthora muscae TaxID=34485 RepID=A0ACC2T2Y1_9FUNG|nr:hypothetical protein DSO57_1023400 [Entomophthora muscae]KAJ9068958.1 hypothetical protein DSO57_1023401 [Entomophthora muscae]
MAKGTLLLFDTVAAKIVCDQCSAAHVKCSRDIPACKRCQRSGLNCTRNRAQFDGRVIYGLSKAGWKLQPVRIRVATWTQVIDMSTLVPLTRFHLRRHLMPLEILLPKASESAEILNISSHAINTLLHPSETRKAMHIHYPSAAIQDLFEKAKLVFFHMFNPFYPLFSEEGFYFLPRSQTLRKLVIQIGLERMPLSDLVKSAMRQNNLCREDLAQLPYTFDSLQCLLLAQFGSRLACLTKTRFRVFCTTNRLLTLFGLYQTPLSSPQWLERTLALHLLNFGSYSLSVGQSIIWLKLIWLKTSSTHLNYGFLQTLTNHNCFPFLSDRIHFITSQAVYHSFTIVYNANIDYTLAINQKSSAACFLEKIKKYLASHHHNFMWGWNSLSQLAHSHPSTLLRQSRLALVLRCNTDYIELMKLISYIPKNPTTRVSTTPLTYTINEFSQQGLDVAIRSVHLASTITPSSFGLDYIHILIPSLAYLMAHHKAFKKTFGFSHHFLKVIMHAREAIAKGTNVPFIGTNATVCLKLIDFLLQRHSITGKSHHQQKINPSLKSYAPNSNSKTLLSKESRTCS